MSEFEVLSLVVACLALIVSLAVWSGQRKLQRESNDLQKVTAELSKRQLELIDQQQRAASKAELSLSLTEQNRGRKLTLRNLGPSDAYNIELESLGTGAEDTLVVKQEIDEKFPLQRLRPTEEVRLTAAVHYGSPMVFKIKLRWEDSVGHLYEEVFPVAS